MGEMLEKKLCTLGNCLFSHRGRRPRPGAPRLASRPLALAAPSLPLSIFFSLPLSILLMRSALAFWGGMFSLDE